MANKNETKHQKTPKSKIAVRVTVIILSFLMLVSSIGLIISGCQSMLEHQNEESEQV